MHKDGNRKVIYTLGVSNFLWALGLGGYTYIFSNFLSSIGATGAEIGLVYTLMMIVQGSLYIPGGLLADAGHRRALLIIPWATPILAPLFYILAQTTSSWLMVIPGVVSFGASWVGVPAIQSYIREAAPDKAQGLPFSVMVSAGSLGLIPSPLIGGFIQYQYGFIALFTYSFVMYAVSTFVIFLVPRLPGDNLPDKNDEWPKKSKSTSSNALLRRLVAPLALVCLLLGVVYIGIQFVSLYLQQAYGFTFFNIQSMYAIQNASSAAIAPTLGRLSDRLTEGRKVTLTIVPTIALMAAYVILLSASTSGLIPLSFLFMGSLSSIYPLMNTTVASVSGGKHVGLLFGVVGTILFAASAATPYAGGVLYDASKQYPFVASLLLSPIILITLYLVFRAAHPK